MQLKQSTDYHILFQLGHSVYVLAWYLVAATLSTWLPGSGCCTRILPQRVPISHLQRNAKANKTTIQAPITLQALMRRSNEHLITRGQWSRIPSLWQMYGAFYRVQHRHERK
jgi:hypothetical protein